MGEIGSLEERPDTQKTLRVLIADSHLLFAQGLEKLLEPSYEVIGIVADGKALVETAELDQPDIVVTEASLPKLSGIDACGLCRELFSALRFVVLSSQAQPDYVRAALDAGAAAYLLKSIDASELLFALRQVVRGHLYVTPCLTRHVIATAREDPTAGVQAPEPAARPESPKCPLTERELEVVQLIAQGLENHEIAKRLFVSGTTVRTHARNASEKLEARNRVELALYALREGWTALERCDEPVRECPSV